MVAYILLFIFPGKGIFHQPHVRSFFFFWTLASFSSTLHLTEFVYLNLNFEMQIMIYWDNMLYLLNKQLYRLLVILAHILPTLDQYIPPLPTLVEQFPKLLISATGMVHLYLVTCQPPTHFLLLIFIITVGITIPLIFLLPAAV